jgi:excisionase family DNA binding protein
MTDDVLTLKEAAEEVKLSEKTLRRVATRGDGPFLKVENRWRVYRLELHAWMRTHRPARRADPCDLDPMPLPRSTRSSLEAKVVELEAKRRAS